MLFRTYLRVPFEQLIYVIADLLNKRGIENVPKYCVTVLSVLLQNAGLIHTRFPMLSDALFWGLHHLAAARQWQMSSPPEKTLSG